MSSEPDAQPDGPDADADVQQSVEPSGLWVRARQSLRVPGVLVRLAKRDPHHIPERLTIYTVDRHADEARVWAERARDAVPESSPAVLADGQRRRTISIARIRRSRLPCGHQTAPATSTWTVRRWSFHATRVRAASPASHTATGRWPR